MGFGKKLKKAFKKLAKNKIVQVAAQAVATIYGGPAAGAAVGAAFGAANGGGLKGAAIGGLSGYAAGVGMNTAGYGSTFGNVFKSGGMLSGVGSSLGIAPNVAGSAGTWADAGGKILNSTGGPSTLAGGGGFWSNLGNTAYSAGKDLLTGTAKDYVGNMFATPGINGGANSGITPQDYSVSGPGYTQQNPGGILSNFGGLGGLLGAGATAAGGYMQGQASLEAAQKFADSQIQAAQIAADAAKFRPVGVMSRFGSSQFGYDQNGNLINAGYTLNPETAAMQNVLMGNAGNYLDQYKGAMNATAPMGQAAQSMMTLGNQYLGTSPQAQAQKYMQEQQALLASGRATDLATMRANLQAQGRGGLAVGGDAGMLAANPEMNAYYNSLRQQDLGLAAQATQGGMDYAKFGAGMVGGGGDMLSSMYKTQSDALNPYSTALGGATQLEGLGQQTMDMGINIGSKGTMANAQSGLLLSRGIQNSAEAMNQANQYSPWGNLLSGFGNAMTQQYGQPQQSAWR